MQSPPLHPPTPTAPSLPFAFPIPSLPPPPPPQEYVMCTVDDKIVVSTLYIEDESGVGHMSPFSNGIGSMRFYSKEVTHIPDIKDPELYSVLKDLLAENWSDLSDAVVSDAKRALSKSTDDSAGKEVVTNVFRAAQAVEEFGGILVTLKMEIDDSIGLSGEDVKPLPDHVQKALRTIFDRYTTYLNAFGPDENYLRKKVEQELGTKMIHLKMRCSGLGSEWGKVTVLGTSGLAGSYVEQRA
ncbi:succinate dehydrogenase 5 [Trifolium pratense]|uniref:Succinate dehydrogenase 5 n=1 Tax=Trifolium pratense TaxID=57577 RepID=A0A2K3PLE7_TRIPR|nr:succinate dehydrogenase 5 [Trifolium pratense]